MVGRKVSNSFDLRSFLVEKKIVGCGLLWDTYSCAARLRSHDQKNVPDNTKKRAKSHGTSRTVKKFQNLNKNVASLLYYLYLDSSYPKNKISN